MTLIIVNHCHDPKSPFGKTFSVYGESNGIEVLLQDRGYHANLLNGKTKTTTDGLPNPSFNRQVCPPFVIRESGRPSHIFEEGE